MQYQAHIPMELTYKFLDKLGYEPENQKILVIRDFFTAMYLAVKNSVIFITDDPEARDMFKNTVMFNPEFGSDDEVIYIDIENNKNAWKEFIEEISNMPKFDVAIMNPPYDRNLHLKILEKVIPNANKVVNISPIRWLQDPLAKYKKHSDYHKFEETISKKIETLDIINAKDSNALFGISNFGALAISCIGNGGYNYDLPAIEWLGNKFSIINKMIDKKPNVISNFYHVGCSTNYNIKVTDICGSMIGLVVNYIHNKIYLNEQDYKNNKLKKSDCHNILKPESFVSFNTENEARNYLNSTFTKFHRFCVIALKMDVHIPLFALPFMENYTQPWDDKRFCEYFGITGYISDTEAVPGSEWEIIVKTMKNY